MRRRRSASPPDEPARGGHTAPGLTPTQIHSQQHLCPILGLGTTGTGLDIHEGATGIHFTAEHPAEFQLTDLGFQTVQVRNQFIHGALVLLFDSHFQQVIRILEATRETIQGAYQGFKLDPFAPQGLGLFLVVPDRWAFQFAAYFFQAFGASSIVKDTP